MSAVELMAWLPIVACSLWTVVGIWTVWRATRRCSVTRPATALPPVSVLKPLCGADPGLMRNLQTFFEQDHPRFQLVFGVEDEHDPALEVVAALRGRYPDIPCRVVVHQGGRAINPKVRNLLAMMPAADHDLVLVSDSNVRAPRHYVRDMVTTMHREPDVGLVTSIFAGRGEDGLGSALENTQLNGFCAAGATIPTTCGRAAVIGKSMLFSRRQLAALGGLGRVADVLAEDYVIGKMYQHAGARIRIAPTVLTQVTSGMTLRAFLARHRRWSLLRSRLAPAAFLLEPLTSPLALLPLAWLTMGPVALGWALATMWLRDVVGWTVLRGTGRLWVPLLTAPLRDLVMIAMWLRAPLDRYVTWRGNRVRVGSGTLLFTRRP